MMSQPFRLSHLGIFPPGGGKLSSLFLMEPNSTPRDLSKNDFFKILSIFFACANIFGSIFGQIFTFGKSARTNRKIFSIPAYSEGFRSSKKSSPVSINRFINLLTLVVRNCTHSFLRAFIDAGAG